MYSNFFLQKKVETLHEELSTPIEGSDEPQVVDEDQLFLKAAGGLDIKTEVMTWVHYRA